MRDPAEDRRTAVEAAGLGMGYRREWALRECAFRIPAGRVCGVVGPNGAGKSTLLALAAGLLRPTEGTIRTFGRHADDPEQRHLVAFVGQDKPLYPRFTVAETLRLGRELNPRWDAGRAQRVVDQGDLDPGARIGSLSGGQRTRVAMALALGKRPELLLLDEPMADMDPLARHQLMGTLMSEAAEHSTTIVMSSHILSELESVIDFLLLVDAGRVRLAGEVEEIVRAHRILVGAHTGTGTPLGLAAHSVIETRHSGRQFTALIRPEGPVLGAWQSSEPTLEELLLGYLRSPLAPSMCTDSARVLETAVTS
ncbi:ABC transporter ATP-binding protein [Streptomyces sp. H39-S7]|uniref:ABC transporter ATP-binding protein n=1 Tax=Streptomyces sp. H39-S7 TaxID=3004357 RepID=UPI0022B04992|nr:ABC transporter ATP-binding protein [Streptomyces sp. H39-S7]MCZ4124388.1 ABC transporter ATP-binding protein [Streptomyces sp. H39-S7]